MSRRASPAGKKGQPEREDEERASFASRAWEQIWPLAAAILVALGIRAVIIESYYVPSGSMFPTLYIGDHVFVNKFSYGARVPFTEQQLPSLKDPKRGRISVFALGRRGPGAICPLDQCPDYPAEGFVKRLVGLPGDTIEFRNGDLYLNGEEIRREDTGRFFEGDDGRRYRVYREYLDGCVHEILDDPRQAPVQVAPIQVPEDRFYFLGDNRDNSNDSRFWGTVHRRDLKGPVMINYWAWNNRESWLAMLNPLTWLRLLWSEMYWDRIGLTYDCWEEGEG